MLLKNSIVNYSIQNTIFCIKYRAAEYNEDAIPSSFSSSIVVHILIQKQQLGQHKNNNIKNGRKHATSSCFNGFTPQCWFVIVNVILNHSYGNVGSSYQTHHILPTTYNICIYIYLQYDTLSPLGTATLTHPIPFLVFPIL